MHAREDDECEVFECSVCSLRLMTGHLLDLHLQEVHDAFFAAQASRHMKVGCIRTLHADRFIYAHQGPLLPRFFTLHAA